MTKSQKSFFAFNSQSRIVRVGKREYALPRSRMMRILLGLVLIICGTLGFLPVLGFWMLPLGLLILSYEFHLIRRLRRRMIVWWRRRKGTARE
ncbi:hypothetical protein [Rhizobium sp. L1K21]|uniref:hypothetical protein n=1 Tax=Rhizobium sp. L1K21 TaxID=2954933 RepID=UPI002091E7F0|nr:hypothetical protein [Rhizobium sp. L1K21]MCO6186317.1 hypothetical protein [Rhizobium sp. L1K21]